MNFNGPRSMTKKCRIYFGDSVPYYRMSCAQAKVVANITDRVTTRERKSKKRKTTVRCLRTLDPTAAGDEQAGREIHLSCTKYEKCIDGGKNEPVTHLHIQNGAINLGED